MREFWSARAFPGSLGLVAGYQDPKNLLPQVSWETREAFGRLAQAFYAQTGLGLRVRSARRTCQAQNDEYGNGRLYNTDNPPTTYAQGCQSWHVTGRAVDADPVDLAGGSVHATCELATVAGQIWEQLGGVWGGRFGGFGECGDQGHFEWHPGLSIASVCPDPAACEAVSTQVQTQKPGSPLWWALGGFLLVAAGGYVYLGRR